LAQELYEVEGLAPAAIQGQLAADLPRVAPVPRDTLKGWLRPRARGPMRDDAPAWDFIKATPEGRRLIAPLLAAPHLHDRTSRATKWPSQDVADWLIAIRQLLPTLPIDIVWLDARYLAMLERRIHAGSATDDDRVAMREYLADVLEQAGGRQVEVLEDTQTSQVYIEVDQVTGEADVRSLEVD